MKNNQKGFGAVEALVIIVIVGLVGFGGWYMWHSNQKEDGTKIIQQSQSKQESKPKDKYLTIKEWGIRLKLNKDAEGSYYILREDGQYVDVFNSNFDKLKNKNGIECKNEILFVVARYSENDPRLEDPTNRRPDAIIGSYGYTGTPAHQAPPGCALLNEMAPFEYDQNVLEIFTKYKMGLVESFKSLEAIR